jgi:hypothetical protein
MNKQHESYLREFFIKMNKYFNSNWCVLHSYETLPYFSNSDVDMAFSSNDLNNLEKLIIKIADKQGWTVYQKLWYDAPKSIYYILKENNNNTFLALDFLVDNNGIGRYGFETSLLTNNCDLFDNFIPIPNSEVAFSYKFVKRIVKKIPIIKDDQYLLNLFEVSNHKKIEEMMISQFGNSGNSLLQKHFKNNNFLLNNTEINFLLKSKKNIFIKSSKYFQKLYWESRRILNRIFFPCGMIIYIPNLSEGELNIFKITLEKKLGILFRFIKLNKSNSLSISLKGLIGSTLIISPLKEKTKSLKIRSHWFLFSRKLLDIQLQDIGNIEDLVNSYYDEILQVLLKRNRFQRRL